jgi:hypothetical protein
MSTFTTSTDLRRTDQRTNILENPFWLTSGLCDLAVVGAGKAAVLFSFPQVGRIIIVQQVIAQTIVALAGTSPTVNFGLGTIASDILPATITYTNTDDFIKTADQSATAGDVWGPASGGSVWLTAALAGLFPTAGNARFIKGAAATVPVVFAAVGGTLPTGKVRLHMLVTILPGT